MDNILKQMSDYNKKRQNGIPPFMKLDAGDIQTSQNIFNNSTECCEELLEEVNNELKYETAIKTPLYIEVTMDEDDRYSYEDAVDEATQAAISQLIDNIVDTFNDKAVFYNEGTKEDIAFDFDNYDYDDENLYFVIYSSELLSKAQISDAFIYALQGQDSVEFDSTYEAQSEMRSEDDWDSWDKPITVYCDIDPSDIEIITD